MKKIRELLFNRWVLGALVVLLLSLVILLVGDAIAFFDWRPLETLLARCVLVSILILCWLGWELIRAWRIRRANQSMLQGIAGAEGEAESSARSAQEIATLQARFKEALTVLRKARFKGRAGERQYLYQLPWYVIVGATGSGKTTALVNSGLKVPPEEGGREPVDQGRRRDAQLRLVVHRRGGAARHRRPLCDPGQRAEGRCERLARFSRSPQALPAAAAAERRDRHREHFRSPVPDRRAARALRARRQEPRAGAPRAPRAALPRVRDGHQDRPAGGFHRVLRRHVARGARA